jgi:hypothetical protein
MGALYERMKADLKLRRYSTRTEKSYLYYAARFARHLGRPPADMGKAEIRDRVSGKERSSRATRTAAPLALSHYATSGISR